MPTTLEKIASIEQSRIDLLSDTDSDLATFHNAARMARLAEMKKDIRAIMDYRAQRAARTDTSTSAEQPATRYLSTSLNRAIMPMYRKPVSRRSVKRKTKKQ
jgi:hypothetical protein